LPHLAYILPYGLTDDNILGILLSTNFHLGQAGDMACV
jgi:hypothetical protein